METIKELYWEALRAPDDPVNFRRNPYLREQYKKKFYGKTRAERLAKEAQLKVELKEHMEKIDQKLAAEVEYEMSADNADKQARIANAKARRKLGFNDIETDAEGKTIKAEDGSGVDDRVLKELSMKQKKYYTEA